MKKADEADEADGAIEAGEVLQASRVLEWQSDSGNNVVVELSKNYLRSRNLLYCLCVGTSGRSNRN